MPSEVSTRRLSTEGFEAGFMLCLKRRRASRLDASRMHPRIPYSREPYSTAVYSTQNMDTEYRTVRLTQDNVRAFAVRSQCFAWARLHSSESLWARSVVSIHALQLY